MLARRRNAWHDAVWGLLGSAIPASGPADQSNQASERQLTEIADALKDLRKRSKRRRALRESSADPQKQMEYLRATNKFPDYIDVGLDVWVAVHDWHIRHLQPPSLGRDPKRPLHDFADGHATRDASRSRADVYQRAVR
jgi:hypothetical protein